MYCTKCGSELPEGVKHCYVCGCPVRQLPPLRTGQDFPAGQPGQTAPASPPYGAAGQQGQQQGRPAYQAPAATGPAYQAGQPLPRPTWPPSPAGPAAPGSAYTAGTPQGTAPAGSSYPPSPPVSPAYQYPAYHHGAAANDPDTVGMLDWLLSNLLILVPVVRFVMLCVWAFGAGTKPSKRSWARAMLILLGVLYLLFFALCVFYAATDPAFPYG